VVVGAARGLYRGPGRRQWAVTNGVKALMPLMARVIM
jgi:hypothetical protein